jgi:ADP-L-glycero-D-manno-heptose 6-epimerase
MNILITGGAGFIGSNLAFEINRRYPEYTITIFDKFNTRERRENGNFKYFGDYKNLVGLNAEIKTGDLNNVNDIKLLLQNQYDIIFHQGAISDTTVLNQAEVIRTNSDSFDLFLDYCLKYYCKLIYASSAGTYGNTNAPNIVGSGEKPENVYGFSKLLMDLKTRNFLINNEKSHVVGLRYFNVYGPGELYKRKTSSMILQLAKQALDKNLIRLFKFGEQKRDFVFISDVVEANIAAIDAKPGIYNVGSGVSRTFNDIYNCLQKELDIEIGVEYFENPYSFYQNNTCAELEISKNNFNFSPKVTLESGIKQYMKIIKNYTKGEWESIQE